MLLAKYNTLDFVDDVSLRKWNTTDNNTAFIINYETGHIPAIQLIVDAATTASLQLMDENDENIGSPLSMTVESTTGYKRLIYLGTTLVGKSDGYYSLKVTVGSNVYYSEMFGWLTDLTGFLKVKAYNLGDFDLGGEYSNTMTDFIFECYVSAEYLGIIPKVNESGDDIIGVTKTTYGSRALVRRFSIDQHEYVYEFLSGLRILSANGTIEFTWNGKTYSAADIVVDTEDDLKPGDIYKISLEFKVISQTISVNNQIS